ncbi:MAG: FHA domain-containing protein [Nannocystis sp.]|nr:FHA domain-containing protein [Nannocystis sp.]
MALRLIIQDEEGATTIVPLGEEEITIGREAGNTIQLTEQNVSRQHARLTLGADGWVLEDLDSYNGIKVNGVPVETQVALNEGDIVQIGDYHLSLADNVERTTLNLDRPAPAANSNDFAEAPSLSVPGDARAAANASPDYGAPLVGPPQMPTLAPPLPTVDEAEESKKRGGGALFLLLGLLAVGVAAAYFGLGIGQKAKQEASKEPPAQVADAVTPTPTPPPTVAPPPTPPDPPVAEPEPEPEPEPALEDPTPTPTPVPKDTKQPKPPAQPKQPKPKPPEDTAPKGDPKALLEQARAASMANNAAEAYKLAKQSHSIDKNKEALTLMGLSACKMGDATKAKAVYAKVDEGTRKKLVYVCDSNGVALE